MNCLCSDGESKSPYCIAFRMLHLLVGWHEHYWSMCCYSALSLMICKLILLLILSIFGGNDIDCDSCNLLKVVVNAWVYFLGHLLMFKCDLRFIFAWSCWWSCFISACYFVSFKFQGSMLLIPRSSNDRNDCIRMSNMVQGRKYYCSDLTIELIGSMSDYLSLDLWRPHAHVSCILHTSLGSYSYIALTINLLCYVWFILMIGYIKSY